MAFTIDSTKDFFYQQGEKQGEERGEKRGKESKALEIATNLLKEGLSTEVIHRVSQLTAEEIEALREKLQKGGKKKQ
jgi:predicted transposase YdaD